MKTSLCSTEIAFLCFFNLVVTFCNKSKVSTDMWQYCQNLSEKLCRFKYI